MVRHKRLMRFGSSLEQYLPPKEGLRLENDIAAFVDYGGRAKWGNKSHVKTDAQDDGSAPSRNTKSPPPLSGVVPLSGMSCLKEPSRPAVPPPRSCQPSPQRRCRSPVGHRQGLRTRSRLDWRLPHCLNPRKRRPPVL